MKILDYPAATFCAVAGTIVCCKSTIARCGLRCSTLAWLCTRILADALPDCRHGAAVQAVIPRDNGGPMSSLAATQVLTTWCSARMRQFVGAAARASDNTP